MIAKELRAARWIALGELAYLLLLVSQVVRTDLRTVTPAMIHDFADAPLGDVTRGQVSLTAAFLWAVFFPNTLYVLVGFGGALFGAGLIAGEVSSGSVSLLLSRPLSRTRVLLTKYAVCAAVLLGLCALCGVFTVALGIHAGATVPSIGGLLVSVILLWLGALFVLGITLVYSVLIPSALAAGFLGFLTTYFLDLGPLIVARSAGHASNQALQISNYWGTLDIFAGVASPLQSLVVSLVAALVPLLVALALFRRMQV